MNIIKQLRRTGIRIIEIILDRTAKGKDINNNPFKPYSTRPFKMPAGALTARAKNILIKNGHLKYFKTKRNTLWVVIIGGYLVLKKAQFSRTNYTGFVNLMSTGKMLGALKVIEIIPTKKGGRIKLGFTRTVEAEKAQFNAEKGREFLGITDEALQKDAVITNIINDIDIDIKGL